MGAEMRYKAGMNTLSVLIALALAPLFYWLVFRYLALPLIRLVEKRAPSLKFLISPIVEDSYSAELNQRYRRERPHDR